ncbi:MAG: hypothetical protein ACREJV_13605 [Candidatus Rokuibacteriota bacterium]
MRLSIIATSVLLSGLLTGAAEARTAKAELKNAEGQAGDLPNIQVMDSRPAKVELDGGSGRPPRAPTTTRRIRPATPEIVLPAA